MALSLIEAGDDVTFQKKLLAGLNGGALPVGDWGFNGSTFTALTNAGTLSGTAGAVMVTASTSTELATKTTALGTDYQPFGSTKMIKGHYAVLMLRGMPAAGGGGGTVTADDITDAGVTGKALIRSATPLAAMTALQLPLMTVNPSFAQIYQTAPLFQLGTDASPNSTLYMGSFATGARIDATVASGMVLRGAQDGGLFALPQVATGNTQISTHLVPTDTNTKALGSALRVWTQLFATNSTITPSDERLKTDIGPIPDAVLDAWATVGFVQFGRVDGDRTHVGVIAQRVKEAFEGAGLDPFTYSLLCHDEWEAVPEMWSEEVRDPETNDVLVPAQLISPAVEAGERYAVRYEEALAMECALMRRELKKLQQSA